MYEGAMLVVGGRPCTCVRFHQLQDGLQRPLADAHTYPPTHAYPTLPTYPTLHTNLAPTPGWPPPLPPP